MGIVRGADGRLYNIPDDELNRYAVEEEKPSVEPAPPRQSKRGRGPVVIQIFTKGPSSEPDVTAQSAWGGWGASPARPSSGGFQQFVIWP